MEVKTNAVATKTLEETLAAEEANCAALLVEGLPQFLRDFADRLEKDGPVAPPPVPAPIKLRHDKDTLQLAIGDRIHQRLAATGYPPAFPSTLHPDLDTWLPVFVSRLGPIRRKLPDEREAINHKFAVGGHEGYINVGLYSDRAPAEVFVTMSKAGSTVRGLMDTIAKLTSLLLQFGVPIDSIADKFRYARFEPQGVTTGCSEITGATSVVDYVFHWLVLRFGHDVEVRAWEPEPDLTHVGTDEVAAETP